GVETEAAAQDVLLALAQPAEDPPRRPLALARHDVLVHLRGLLVGEHLVPRPIALLADVRVERDRARHRLERTPRLRLGHAELLRDLAGLRRAAERLRERARGAAGPPPLVHQAERHADRLALARGLARHRLTDPPRGVGREARADAVVELVDRAHQAEVALLHEIRERHAAAPVALG